MKSDYIYLDYNASAPIDPEVNQKVFLVNALEGNPSSSHNFGLALKNQVDESIQTMKSYFNTPLKNSNVLSEIIFTSGATESINMVFNSIASLHPKGHIITVKTEHTVVLSCCENLKKEGFEVSYLSVNENGEISLEELEKSIKPNTCLISMMWVNNETGLIHPIEEVAKIAKRNKVLFMVDGTQAVGKVDINLSDTPIDYFVCSAHKIYGPKGIGLVYQNIASLEPTKILKPLIDGGGQQNNQRGGTLNTSGIVGFSKAVELLKTHTDEKERIKYLRDYFENELLAIDGVSVNGSKLHRVYNTTNLHFNGVETETLISACKFLAFSQGSACSSKKKSHVLKAMGYSNQHISRSVRISIGRFTTEKEIKTSIELIASNYKRLKNNNFTI